MPIFEAAQPMFSEHNHLLTKHSKSSSHNVSAICVARGNRPGRGYRERGGRSGGGFRGGGAGMLSGEWYKRGIANSDNDFAVNKLNKIDKCWYPDPEYQKMIPLEKRRLYLNQKIKINPLTGLSISPQPLSIMCLLLTPNCPKCPHPLLAWQFMSITRIVF